jgi:cytoskeleton protein RodZ
MADMQLGATSMETGDAPPGATLAQRRAARGLEPLDIANRLKFHPRQIEALEADEYDKLPGMTFVRGMIRNYARFLELDPAPLIQSLERRHAPAPVSVEMASERIPFPDGRTRSTRIYLLLSAFLVVAVCAVVYEWYFGVPQALTGGSASTQTTSGGAVPPKASSGQDASPAFPPDAGPPRSAESGSEPPTAAPQPATAEPGTPAESSSPASLVFEFQGESWVEVKDGTGKVLTARLNAAGSRKELAGEPPFALVIGNPARVRLTYRNVPVDLRLHTNKLDVARLTLR